MSREWCCRECAHWYEREDDRVRWGDPNAHLQEGVCTLYPTHIETIAGHFCGQYAQDRSGYGRMYESRASLFLSEEIRKDNYDGYEKAKKEVKRLQEVAKGMRRKLKEERAKK